MNEFIEKLKNELKKRYAPDEINEIIGYYQEMIHDRVENGENVDLVIADYNINDIVRNVGPTIYANKSGYKGSDTRKGAQSLLNVLFSTVATVPLGILYIIFLILMVCFTVTGIVIALAGLCGLLYVVAGVVIYDTSLGVSLGLGGLVLMVVPISILACLVSNKISKVLSKLMLKWASKIIRKRGA